MADHEALDSYLDTAPAGLADDRELQLEIRCELRAHVEDRCADAAAVSPGWRTG